MSHLLTVGHPGTPTHHTRFSRETARLALPLLVRSGSGYLAQMRRRWPWFAVLVVAFFALNVLTGSKSCRGSSAQGCMGGSGILVGVLIVAVVGAYLTFEWWGRRRS
jgi:hypothetical protein